MDIETRVANGVDLLNEYGPAEWWNLVDLTTLDVGDMDFCVLAQVYIGEYCPYTAGLDALDEFMEREYEHVANGGLYGFGHLNAVGDAHMIDEMVFLTQEWAYRIRKIRVEVNA